MWGKLVLVFTNLFLTLDNIVWCVSLRVFDFPQICRGINIDITPDSTLMIFLLVSSVAIFLKTLFTPLQQVKHEDQDEWQYQPAYLNENHLFCPGVKLKLLAG